MRASTTMLALLGGLAAAGPAWADDDCWVPMADWQPRDAVERMAEAQGWTVRRIRIDDGCYQVEGLDAEGRRVEVTVDPATLSVVEVEAGYDEEGGHGHDEADDREAGASSEAGRHGD